MDIYKLLDKYQLHPYFLKGCTVSFKVLMESDPQTTCGAVQYTDNETGVDSQRERMVVAQCCRYKQRIQLVDYHPLFHQYAENYYV